MFGIFSKGNKIGRRSKLVLTSSGKDRAAEGKDAYNNVLVYLLDGSKTPDEVGRQLHMNPDRVAQIADHLRRQGYVMTTTDTELEDE